MIKKLKTKFIILSMSSLFVLLSVLVVGMNMVNYSAVVSEADTVLTILSDNRGRFPEMGPGGPSLPHGMSPELPYESRYFSALLDNKGNIIQTDTSKVASVSISQARKYASEARDSKGFIDNFRYIKFSEGENTRITFLDCGRSLDSFNRFLFASISISLIGYIIVFIVIVFFSEKIIRPISESYEKQKRFITDAGHEIKTPLTIINANADLLEMELGKNECLEDIKAQSARLTSLTNDLVLLSRMEETKQNLPMAEFPISDVVSETASFFVPLLKGQNKELITDIAPKLSLIGNAGLLGQLVSILLDNALKYSPESSEIFLSLRAQNKSIILTVSNKTENPLPKENLNLIFERFYRAESSHNSETGGHGIGLSIAKAIVLSHSGKIKAYSEDGSSLKISAIFPL